MPYQRIKKVSNLSFIDIAGDYSERGCEAQFYRLGNRKYGIKLYTSFRLAKESYERQKKASEHGLAPKVGKMIIASKNSGKKVYYGYQTEKAKEVTEYDTIYIKQSKSLLKSLRKIGLGGDLSDTNCGILKNKLVAVDFGSHSTRKEW